MGKKRQPIPLGTDWRHRERRDDEDHSAPDRLPRGNGQLALKSSPARPVTRPRRSCRSAGETLVYVGQTAVTAHEPATGKTLWKWDWPGAFPEVAQPQLAGQDRILLTASYGVGSAPPGSRSGKPVPVWKTTPDEDEVQHCGQSPAAMPTDSTKASSLCPDLATGKRVWRGGTTGSARDLLVGDTLLIQAEDGAVALVRSNPGGVPGTGPSRCARRGHLDIFPPWPQLSLGPQRHRSGLLLGSVRAVKSVFHDHDPVHHHPMSGKGAEYG